MEAFLQLLINGVLVGFLYGLVAFGFVLIVKGSGVINFAQGHLMLLGAYLVAWLSVDRELSIYVAVPAGMLFMMVVGLIIERFALRPLENEPLLSLVMATIALAIVIEGATFLAFGEHTRALPRAFPQEPLLFGGLRIRQLNLWAMGISLVFMAGFGWFFTRSRLGLAMQAVSDDRLAAQALGVNTRRVNAGAWALAGAIAAFGGFVWGSIIGVGPTLIVVGLFFVFPVVILGGLESILGAIIGGITVGVIQNLAGGYIDPIIGGGFSTLAAPALLLLIVLIVRPYGLFGRPKIERV